MSLLKLKSIFSPDVTNPKFQDNQSNLQNLDSKFDDGLTTLTEIKPGQSQIKNLNTIFKTDLNNNFNSFISNRVNGVDDTNLLNEPPQPPLNVANSNDFTQTKLLTYDTEFKSRELIEKLLTSNAKFYISNNINDMFDTKLDYNTNDFVSQTYNDLDVSLLGRSGRLDPPLDSILRGREYKKIRFSQDFRNENLFVKPESGDIIEQLFKSETFDPRASFAKPGTLYFNVNNSFNPATNPTDFSTAGIQETPFTPISDLGGQFFDNLSWENLYNSNHTPKEDAQYKGILPISYGINVSRDNLIIGASDNVIGEKSGFNRGDEPYIVSEIGQLGREKNSGNRHASIKRAATDGDRILQFLESNEGRQFILRQNLNVPIENTVIREGDSLFRTPQRFNTIYNPLSTLGATNARLTGGIPEILFKSGISSRFSDIFFPNEYGKDATDGGFNINDTFTQGTNESGNIIDDIFTGVATTIGQTIASTVGVANKTKITTTTKGDKMTLSNMITGNSLNKFNESSIGLQMDDSGVAVSDVVNDAFKAANAIQDVTTGTIKGLAGAQTTQQLEFNLESESEGMPFYFKDLRDNTYIFFRAYIEGLTENISPSYAPSNYLGRSEPVYIYERAEREIAFTLKLVAQTKGELLKIYQKMDRLTSMCYPQYEEDIKVNYGNRMKPPLAKLRYGELYGNNDKELMGYIKSLNYTVDNSSTYETSIKQRVPRHITATISYQVIHDIAPRLDKDFKFYGINK